MLKIKGIEITQEDINRFYSKITVITEGPNAGCWEINLAESIKGYKLFSVNRSSQRAHRFMYMIHHQEENIDGKIIRHSCNHPWCCCPDHLSSGSHQDNRNDCVSDDRQAKGENNGSSVLTEEKVIEILDGILKFKFKSITEISSLYLVGITAIVNILHGKTWTYITNDYDLKNIINIIRRRLSDVDVKDIRHRLSCGETIEDITKIYNVAANTVRNIKNNKIFKNVI